MGTNALETISKVLKLFINKHTERSNRNEKKKYLSHLCDPWCHGRSHWCLCIDTQKRNDDLDHNRKTGDPGEEDHHHDRNPELIKPASKFSCLQGMAL
jgi:hypothetical protein